MPDGDYEEKNGVHVYKPGKKPTLPIKWPEELYIFSPYGFKIITIKDSNKKDKEVWAVATEDDYKDTIGKLQGKKPEQVGPKKCRIHNCHSTGPNSCSGGCYGDPTVCKLVYNPSTSHYVCDCD
jgi:hypothetical protein